MSETNGNGRQRARARVAHLYLEEGLVDEAKKELEVLIGELAGAVEVKAAESNGGGRHEKPATRARSRGAGKARAPKAKPEAARPSRPSPEQAAAAVAEHRATHPAEVPAPVSDSRSARAFTPEERAKVAEYARDNTVTKACEIFNLSWPCVRDWVDKYPRRSLAGATS